MATAALQLAGKRSKDDFDKYWAVHANREYCADWFLWQFLTKQFAPVARQQIQSVPSPDRELIILWIGKGRSDFANLRYTGYSDAELLAAAKQLGRDNVLAVLRNQPPTADPDILRNNGLMTTAYEHYSEMGHFLLAHAKDVLDPSDANALLYLETEERNIKNPQVPTYREWWPIAVASLRPKEADAILDAAQTRWPNAPNIQLCAVGQLGARFAVQNPPVVLQFAPGTARIAFGHQTSRPKRFVQAACRSSSIERRPVEDRETRCTGLPGSPKSGTRISTRSSSTGSTRSRLTLILNSRALRVSW